MFRGAEPLRSLRSLAAPHLRSKKKGMIYPYDREEEVREEEWEYVESWFKGEDSGEPEIATEK